MRYLALLAIFALPVMAQAPAQDTERQLAASVIYEQALTLKSLQGQIAVLQQQLAAAKSEAEKCKAPAPEKK